VLGPQSNGSTAFVIVIEVEPCHVSRYGNDSSYFLRFHAAAGQCAAATAVQSVSQLRHHLLTVTITTCASFTTRLDGTVCVHTLGYGVHEGIEHVSGLL
jgi:hypothetical protein